MGIKEKTTNAILNILRCKAFPELPEAMEDLFDDVARNEIKKPFSGDPETPEEIEAMLDRWKLQDKIMNKAIKEKKYPLQLITYGFRTAIFKYENIALTWEQYKLKAELEKAKMIELFLEWQAEDNEILF